MKDATDFDAAIPFATKVETTSVSGLPVETGVGFRIGLEEGETAGTAATTSADVTMDAVADVAGAGLASEVSLPTGCVTVGAAIATSVEVS